MAAPIRIAKPPSGVLPVANASTQPSINGSNTTATPAGQKQPSSRLKVVIRRLAPGLTQAEFESAIGDEWKVGGGKVSWANYEPGKLSKDLAKASRPSRAIFQLTSADHLPVLSQKVSTTKFTDAANTADDSCLIGPPIVEFAPYSRIPSSKKRNDVRQGTIDTDPEFISFLESLTQVLAKPAAIDAMSGDAVAATGGDKTEEEKPVTPLIQHLRDKKAAKEKAASAKASGKHSKASKSDGASDAKSDNKPGKDGSGEKKSRSANKKERVIAKEAVKKVSKTDDTAHVPSKKTQDTTEGKREATKSSREAPASRRSETGSSASRGSAAAALIQRDLGLRGGRGGSSRSAGESRAKASKSESSDPPSKQSNTASTTEPAPTASTANNVKSPKPSAATPASTTGGLSTSRKPTALTPGATAAFLKHANPSQGITEPLIQERMSSFGQVTKVELDKRKGFAYVDFATHDSLKAAVEAGTVKVGEGAVIVMERRQPNPPGTSNSGGGKSTATAAAAAPFSSTARGGRGNTHSTRGASTAQSSSGTQQPPTTAQTSTSASATPTPTASSTNTAKEAGAAGTATDPPSGPASASTSRGSRSRGSGYRGRGGRGGRGRGASGASQAAGGEG